MIEVIIVWQLCKKLGEKLRDKGRKPFWFQVLLVAMWIGGEILGAIIGVIIDATQNGGQVNDVSLLSYGLALVGAACGAGSCFLIVSFLEPKTERDVAFSDPTQATSSSPSFDDPTNPYSAQNH